MIRAAFVSDLHLKTMDERNSQTLLRFFRSWMTKEMDGDRPTHLFLVGDIFDLWIGAHDYFVRGFEPLVTALRELVASGVEVHFFEGNHDLYLRPFWDQVVGVQVHTDGECFDLGGVCVRVEHGDLINPDDKGYLFLRRFLRTRAMNWLGRNLPASVVRAIGERASSASRQYTSTAKGLHETEIRRFIRAHAERIARKSAIDAIITGHVHVVDDFTFEVNGRAVRSINLGSWFDQPRILVLNPDRSWSWLEMA
ncbi:MAG: UDP-2,3-diacylglucosamine diphosphatase [Bdellovibrionaceae bacterium]|nr:UDP-2,3-diacylglucosamine diphosphatase [Pseudobdellovibrionaceae bacterium]